MKKIKYIIVRWNSQLFLKHNNTLNIRREKNKKKIL